MTGDDATLYGRSLSMIPPKTFEADEMQLLYIRHAKFPLYTSSVFPEAPPHLRYHAIATSTPTE